MPTRFSSVQFLIDLFLQQLSFFFEFSQVLLHRSQTFLYRRLGLLDLGLENAFAIFLSRFEFSLELLLRLLLELCPNARERATVDRSIVSECSLYLPPVDL